jgi:hypothetical protein
MAKASFGRYLAEKEEVLYELKTKVGRVAFTDRRVIILDNNRGFRDVANSHVTSMEVGQKANLIMLQYGSISLILVLWLFLLDQFIRLEYFFVDVVAQVLLIFGVILVGSYFVFREPAISLVTVQGSVDIVPAEEDPHEALSAISRIVRGQG